MKTIFEEMGGTYSEIGGYLIPDLVAEDAPPLKKYGWMRKQYLKEHRPVLYTNLLLSDNLYPHCAEIECVCEDRLELIVRQMAEQEGVTEALKATDQMEWVSVSMAMSRCPCKSVSAALHAKASREIL